MKRTDQQICVDAVREARRILSEFSEPGSPHDAKASLYKIMDVLDNQTVDAALQRIDGRNHFGVVGVDFGGPPRGAPGDGKSHS